jgi:hypothetical protein
MSSIKKSQWDDIIAQMSRPATQTSDMPDFRVGTTADKYIEVATGSEVVPEATAAEVTAGPSAVGVGVPVYRVTVPRGTRQKGDLVYDNDGSAVVRR